MAIECSECNQSVWCIKVANVWICKACFVDKGGDVSEWNTLNELARKEREQRRGEPRINKAPEPKECKYECGKYVIWDYKLEGSNKFKEVDTGIPHTYPRCADIRKEKGLGMDVYKKK